MVQEVDRAPDERVACHEAGHCVVAYVLGATIESVSIAPPNAAENEGGFEQGRHRCHLPTHTSPHEDLDLTLQINHAGALATLKALGTSAGSSDDVENSRRAFEKFIAFWPGRIEESCETYVERFRAPAEKILLENWRAVVALAAALLAARSLPGAAAERIIQQALA